MTRWSMLRALAGAVLGLSLTQGSFAADFATADRLYAQRENNHEAIAQARAQYVQLLDSATNVNDKIRAAEQLGRLALYEGEMITAKSDSAGRRAIFGDCWCRSTSLFSRTCNEPGWVEKISPAQLVSVCPLTTTTVACASGTGASPATS
jgi:hypothetical protein